MKKVSISILALQEKYGDKEALRIAKEIGADAVDFSLYSGRGRFDCQNADSIYAKSEQEFIAYFTDLRRYAESIGLDICMTHGRLDGLRNIPEKDEALYENARLDCYATALLGSPVCVVHGVTTIYHMDTPPEMMREMNFQMFCRMIPYAKQYGIKMATETFGDVDGCSTCDFFGNIDEFIATYERICAVEDNRDYFTVCVDTGHSNKATKFNNNPKPPQVIRMLGNRVTCLHLNDNNTVTDQHLIPFVAKAGYQIEGTIDWDDVFATLEDIGYNGYYNMELELARYGEEIMPETARFAIIVLKNALEKRERLLK